MYGYDESKVDLDAMSKWYGFPVQRNVASREYDVTVNGKPFKATASIDRWFTLSDEYKGTKSTAHKGLPLYKASLAVPEIGYSSNAKIQKKERWGSYDENAFTDQLLSEYAALLSDDQSKMRKAMNVFEDATHRQPEYTTYIKDLADRQRSEQFDFTVHSSPYQGTYQFAAAPYSIKKERPFTIDLELVKPSSDAPLPSRARFTVSLVGTRTADDFEDKVEAMMENNHDAIEKLVVDYLQTFPYLESQKADTKTEAERVMEFLKPPYDVQAMIRELAARGYLYQTKKQKQEEGLSAGGTKWVVDSKRAIADSRNYGYLSKTPGYFFAVVAYAIHRKVRGIMTVTEWTLMDVIGSWANAMAVALNRPIDARFAVKAVDAVAEAVVLEIWPKETREQKERRFREQFYGTGGKTTTNAPSAATSLDEFKEFAGKYDIDAEEVDASPRAVYRMLAKMLHPDKAQDKSKAETEFKLLQAVWDKVPDEFKKNATDWLSRYVVSKYDGGG
jgi:hypothetical protein